ncbi:glycosyltransferase family 4 protein [Lachnospira pectinoschiza]|uniref:Glycosyltransferase involved in cell wall bisynthesis n=1 Tax=Lachnospira pectinoschiza TaxID=28052 RepID=A0A1G9SRW7_9FIRM|nr:glycosyltransferase family 4 protein [Lachnospira pectinoschiza]SDM38114.1 Glycosyltransferase involved in cell wall bisynthesis [Lachnospira pectinoschiza]
MKKIALVVQRYGKEVNGGAEQHARFLVEHLRETNKYEIEVLTTKAIDYLTWEDEYKDNIEEINGITVRRFSVKHPRNLRRFGWISTLTDIGIKTKLVENLWLKSQGPYSKDLIDYIDKNKDNYDLFIFMTYLYYPTVVGMPKVASKSILIPTAHDEPTIYMNMYKNVFRKPAAIFYNTVSEKEFVEKTFSNADVLNNNGFGGVGVEINKDLEDKISRSTIVKDQNLQDYILYVGRIDTHKGCDKLFEYYKHYIEHSKSNLQLVLVGKPAMDIPKDPNVRYLGFLSEEDKFAVMKEAKLLIVPSEFESLSMVLLESLYLGVPVLVNAKCEVLKQHCLRGDVGKFYYDYQDFEGNLNKLLSNSSLRTQLGINGQKYVDKFYSWDTIIDKLDMMIEKVIDNNKLEEK